jgi:hypothetical protein
MRLLPDTTTPEELQHFLIAQTSSRGSIGSEDIQRTTNTDQANCTPDEA